jgi:hypothetical protein
MCKLREILSAAILVWFVSTPSSAMPFSAQTILNGNLSIENSRFAMSLGAAGRVNQRLMPRDILIQDMGTGQPIDL